MIRQRIAATIDFFLGLNTFLYTFDIREYMLYMYNDGDREKKRSEIATKHAHMPNKVITSTQAFRLLKCSYEMQ